MIMHSRFGVNIKETNACEGIWMYYVTKVVNLPQVLYMLRPLLWLTSETCYKQGTA